MCLLLGSPSLISVFLSRGAFSPWSIIIWSRAVFFFKQKTAYEMRISDWSSDVCSSDLTQRAQRSYEPRRPFMALRKRQPDARRFRFANRSAPSASLREMKEIRRDGVGRAFDSGFENAYFGEITISI